MACEPCPPKGNAFIAAYIDMEQRVSIDLVYQGVHVQLRKTFGDRILLMAGWTPYHTENTLGFFIKTMDTGDQTFVYLQCSGTGGVEYCPDVVYLGPVTSFASHRALLSAAVRAACTLQHTGYRPSFLLQQANDGSFRANMAVYHYRGDAASMAPETYNLRGNDVHMIRMEAERARAQLHQKYMVAHAR